MILETIALAQRLIERPSITPHDAGCQAEIAMLLMQLGFTVSHHPIGEVDNLWAVIGEGGPTLCFAGHTDVVPTGPVEQWRTPPFDACIKNGYLHGRGAADMKGSIAAMLSATCTFLKECPTFNGRIAYLITSDEEGPAIDGTQAVLEHLIARGEKIDYCLVGEPSATERTGDMIRVGRRGSLHADIEIRGQQGHVAYPTRFINPNHTALSFLSALAGLTWDEGKVSEFPETSCQIVGLESGLGVRNVVPGLLKATVNWRFSPQSMPTQIESKVMTLVKEHNLNATIAWHASALPFYTSEHSQFRRALIKAIEQVTNSTPECSTGGGTSDGRFFALLGICVLECGPCSATIHEIDEKVSLADLEQLTAIYTALLHQLFGGEAT